jgi:hypothetical protein
MKKLVLFLSLVSLAFCTELLKIKKYSLKKDQTKKILVKYGSSQKVYSFRWTLFKNDALIVFSSYDTIVSQHVLLKGYKNDSIKVELKPKGAYEYNVPYMLIKFDSFDFAKKEAKFSVWLYDKREEVYIKYLN